MEWLAMGQSQNNSNKVPRRGTHTPFLVSIFTITLLLSFSASNANAWESDTTHAGLTEESVLSSNLHKRLVKIFDLPQGLLEVLRVPSQDAPALFSILRRLNPTHGYVPNGKDEMNALSWIVAGSVVADIPSQHAANHFLDPRTQTGLSDTYAKGILFNWSNKISGSRPIAASGISAVQWWIDRNNPMGYPGFIDQFRKAVSSPSPAMRNRHLAGSLLAAGSMLHILQDMGSPSHVRNDMGAHQERLSAHRYEHGSRFERIAALAFGRLGIPKSQTKPSFTNLLEHFSNAKNTGLANITERSYFSYKTLPNDVYVRKDMGASIFQEAINKKLKRPKPAANSQLDLIAARNEFGATWRNKKGVCLTRYQWKLSKLNFWIDDECALEQLESILPRVAAYGASFIMHLYSDSLDLQAKGTQVQVSIRTITPKGTLTFFTDDKNGIRKKYAQLDYQTGQTTQAPLPQDSNRITVLYEGVDANGFPLLSTGTFTVKK